MTKGERGVGLIEVLIALAILGLVAAAFLSGLATATKAVFIADERTTAESLARSQMEYVKNQGYKDADIFNPYDPGPPPTGGEVTYDKITGIPDGYTIWSENHAGQLRSYHEHLRTAPHQSRIHPCGQSHAVEYTLENTGFHLPMPPEVEGRNLILEQLFETSLSGKLARKGSPIHR